MTAAPRVRTCGEEGCDRPVLARKLCGLHYDRKRRTGTTSRTQPTLEERFWAKVRKTDECWIWTGARRPEGYGNFCIAPRHYEGAHRVAYRLTNGSIPTGLHLDHLCRNPPCVRPDHLEPVTVAENTARGMAPNAVAHRTRTCKRGHERPERGDCRTCKNERDRERRAGSLKRPADGTRQVIYGRCRGLCEKCGRPMALSTMHLHHRLMRSQGGGHGYENLMGVHGHCHNVAVDSIHQEPRTSYANGWLLRSHQDPAVERLAYDGQWQLLTADGGRRDAA